MATINPTRVAINGAYGSGIDDSVIKVVWSPVTENDTCAAIALPAFSDKSVHFYGTFGGATVVLKGSNNAGATYVGLKDPSSTAISATSEKINAVLENTELVQPVASGGSGQSLSIALVCRLSNPLRN